MDDSCVFTALGGDVHMARPGTCARRDVHQQVRGTATLSRSWPCLCVRFYRQSGWTNTLLLSRLLFSMLHGKYWCLGSLVSFIISIYLRTTLIKKPNLNMVFNNSSYLSKHKGVIF